MADTNNMLLICEQEASSWSGVVVAALAPFGHLQIAPVNKALALVQQQPQQLIIVDAACVQDAPALVVRIRAICPGARVVIATASPTWRRAREAFQAGATDYVRKSLSARELREAFADALNKTPPP
jgi:DNA-binding NtrC family response regulator